MVLALTLPFPRPVLRFGFRVWMWFIMTTLRYVAGISYEMRGLENLPPGGVILASKHQSAWETGIFLLIMKDASYILKKELLSIPLYGWLLRKGGMIAIDREGGASALKKLVSEVREAVQQDRQVIIFPEGTRSLPGSPGTYHPGVAALYQKSDVPVIPVALNSGCFWSRRSFYKKPGHIVVEFLEPMPTGLKSRDFMSQLEQRVEEASNRLLKDAGFQREEN